MNNTSRLLDKLYRYFVWIIVVVSIVGYLLYRTIQFNGDLESVVTSVDTWVNIVFSIWLHLNILQGAIDGAVSSGLQSPEFVKADELNNKIIRIIQNKMPEFRHYVKKLNENERAKLEEDFFFKCGVETYAELTAKQKKQFAKLKPIIHDIYGYNLPLYYELTKDGKLSYKAEYVKNKGMWGKRVSKILSAVLFGVITINISINVSGMGEAMISVGIMAMGMVINFMMAFIQPYFKLRYEIPKSVVLKATLYNGFSDFENGKVQLKELAPITPETIVADEILPLTETTPTSAENEPIKEPIKETD